MIKFFFSFKQAKNSLASIVAVTTAAAPVSLVSAEEAASATTTPKKVKNHLFTNSNLSCAFGFLFEKKKNNALGESEIGSWFLTGHNNNNTVSGVSGVSNYDYRVVIIIIIAAAASFFSPSQTG